MSRVLAAKTNDSLLRYAEQTKLGLQLSQNHFARSRILIILVIIVIPSPTPLVQMPTEGLRGQFFPLREPR